MALQKSYEYSPVNTEQQTDNKNFVKFEEEFKAAPALGHRHVQICVIFFLGFVAYSFRVSLPVGIVAMMDPNTSSNPNITTYPDWTKKNIILSSFFWGYALPQMFAAWAAKTYGPKWFLIAVISIQSILSILTPVTAGTFGEKGMIASRAVEGFCQGFVFPSCTHLLSRWVPPQERSRFGSAAFTAGKLGTLMSVFLTGIISASSYGWPWAFRILGMIGLTWCVMMAIFGYNSPSEHPKISKVERTYIETSLGQDNKKHRTPWKAILTSPRMWAIFAAQMGQNYPFWVLMSQMPSYFNYVMRFNMKNNAVWSALPYLVMFILAYVFGHICDTLINKGIFSRTVARKVFNSIGFGVPAIAIVVLGYTNPNQSTQAIILSIIAIGVSSSCYSGYGVNHMDLSPNHAGMIMGFINGFAQISGVLAPLVVQMIVTDVTNVLQWRVVFFTASATYMVSGAIFVIFGSGKVQSWNTADEDVEK